MKTKTVQRLKTVNSFVPIIYFLFCFILLVLLVNIYKSAPLNEISIMQSLQQQIIKKPLKHIYISEMCTGRTEALQTGIWSGISPGFIAKKNAGNLNIEQEKNDQNFEATGVQSNLLQAFVTKLNRKRLFCGEYFSNSEFYYGQECDTVQGYHKCNSKVCVKVEGAVFNMNRHCPITDITIIDAIFNNEIKRNGNFFIVNFETGFGPQCINPELLPEKPSKTNYPLYQHLFTGCDKYGSFDKLSTVIYGKSFACLDHLATLGENKRQITEKNAPFYSEYIASLDQDCLQLYQRLQTQIVSDPACYKVNAFEKMPAVRTYALQVNHLTIIYGSFCLILNLYAIIISIAYIFLKNKPKIFYSLISYIHLVSIILAFFLIIFFIHYMRSISVINNSLINVKNDFEKAANKQCYEESQEFSEAFSIVLSFLKWNFNLSYTLIIILFVITIFYLIIFAIIFLLLQILNASIKRKYYQYQ